MNELNTSLLIHCGAFPGILRKDSPRLLANNLFNSLANANMEYRRSGKSVKFIIHVPNDNEYE
jgi:hypothetical protein